MTTLITPASPALQSPATTDDLALIAGLVNHELERQARDSKRQADLLFEQIDQNLAALGLHLSLLEQSLAAHPEAHHDALDTIGMARSILAQSHGLARELTPAPLAGADMRHSLWQLCLNYARRSRRMVDFFVSGQGSLDGAGRLLLFRFLELALEKYGGSLRKVHLSYFTENQTGRDDGGWRCELAVFLDDPQRRLLHSRSLGDAIRLGNRLQPAGSRILLTHHNDETRLAVCLPATCRLEEP